MRLLQVLETVNQFEKNAFLKILDNISCELREQNPEVAKILSQNEGEFKNIDNSNVVELFKLCRAPFKKNVVDALRFNNFQLDIVLPILVRDGNSIMSRDWFYSLYSEEIALLKKQIASVVESLNTESKSDSEERKRDYDIYRACVKTAYENDELLNREKKISIDEKLILDTLSDKLELSGAEARELYYSVVDFEKLEVDFLIQSMKDAGIAFFKRNDYSVYVPDEIVQLLRDLCGMEISATHFRRVLRNLSDSQINRVSRKHGIEAKLSREEKIRAILRQGISLKKMLLEDIHKTETSKSDRKKLLSELIDSLELEMERTGSTAEERIELMTAAFLNLEQDDNIGMPESSFGRFLEDLGTTVPEIVPLVREEFELQQEDVLKTDLLKSYSIKPVDLLNLLSPEHLKRFCDAHQISTRGDDRSNVMAAYRDMEDFYLENYALIASRDLNALKEKGISIKEADLGLKFEELTQKLLQTLGFIVDQELKKNINTARTKADIILRLPDNELVIVECKTQKNQEYSKYAAVSRQLTSYVNMCKDKGFTVSHCIVISSDFTDDFIAECEYDCNLHLSLITAAGLSKIVDGFGKSAMKMFPQNLFKKSGLIDADRVIQVINR